jgi:RimJ/RimL family protein N-acetyltransferase
MTAELAGPRLIIRRLRVEDVAKLAAFFRRLSPHSRLRRFHGAVNELPPALLERLTTQDEKQGATLVAVIAHRGREHIVGEARYAIDEASTRGAEFAIAIADRFQRCGVGKRLGAALMRLAARRHIDRLYGDVQYDNQPMLALARKLGFRERRAFDPRLRTVERVLQAAPSAH